MSADDRHPLQPLRDETVPEPDPAFRERLDARLRVAHAAGAPTPSRPRLSRLALAVPALVVVMLVGSVALIARDESAVAALELRDAHNVVVTLPDGDRIRDPEDGFRLVDGAVVTVGEGGAVTIDDVTLSGGAVVTVRDGSLVADVIGTSTTAGPDRVEDRRDGDADPPEPDPPGEPATATTTTTPTTTGRSDEPSREVRDDPIDTTATDDADPTGDRPAEVDRPPDPPADGDGHGDTVAPEADAPLAIALRLFAEDGRVRVVWEVTGPHGPPDRVVVVRTTDGTDPDWPAGTGTTVGEGAKGEIIEQRRDLPDDLRALRYRVLVLDPAGGVVARGTVQTLSGR